MPSLKLVDCFNGDDGDEDGDGGDDGGGGDDDDMLIERRTVFDREVEEEVQRVCRS